MSSIKEKYQRFRRWQENPFNYQDSHDRHVCSNCGMESDNNYCPRCGQKAVYGPITWRSVWRGVMDVWGVGSRSLPSTLWQLMWRPGYLIRDYISGKRQVSFPPVKMMMLLGVIVILVSNWLEPEEQAMPAVVSSTGLRYYYDVVSNWLNLHGEWQILIAFSFLIVPIWSLFREAPVCRHHSLPQGFFIQVFNSSLFFMLMSLCYIPLLLFCDDFNEDLWTFIVFVVIVPLILLVVFKQLFGYGWWGTIWRVAMAVPMGILVFRICLQFGRALLSLFESGVGREFWLYLLLVVDGLVLLWLCIEIVAIINRKEWHEQGWWHVLRRPALAALVLLLTGWTCHHFGRDNSLMSIYQTYMLLSES